MQNIRWSSGVFGWLAGGKNGGYSPLRRCVQKPHPNHRQATHCHRRSVPYGLISRCRRRPLCRSPRSDGTFFLSSCSRKHTRWKRGRLRDHKFFSYARLSKFGQGLRSVCQPCVGLSKPTLDGFCDGHKDFLQLYRLLSTFSTMDYVKNAQSCVNRVHTIRGTYGGTYDTQSCFSPGLLDPKSLILIWDTGAMASLRFGVILLTMSSVKFLSGMSLRSTQ